MDTSPDKSGARQFSLRKLFLWIAVCAVYLGILRLAGTEPISAIVVTVWLAVPVILIGRLSWGLRGGLIAVVVMAIVLGFVVSLSATSKTLPFYYIFATTVAFFGIPVGVLAYLFISAGVCLVNWLDSLGRKPRPPDS